MGVAYDLFGNGKTALKFNLGKYMEAITATNSDLDMNPLIRTAISTTRAWTDTNKDFVPNCDLDEPGEERRMRRRWTTRTSGSEVFDRTFDPDFIERLGHPSLQLGRWASSVQQEVVPRVSVNVGYFRNWWGNWYAVDNRSTSARGLHAVQHHGAGRSAAAGRRRLDDQRPVQPRARARSGRSTSSRSRRRTSREQTENWQGVDVSVSARLRNGLTVQGGTSTGRRLADACALKAVVPEQGQGTRGDDDVDRRRLADEPVLPHRRAVPDADPRARDVHDSEDRRPGERHVAQQSRATTSRRTTSVTSADRRGRSRSAATSRRGNVTVNLIEPGTLYSRSAEQHRLPRREDLPVRPDADAGRARHLQPDEHGRRDELQPDVRRRSARG